MNTSTNSLHGEPLSNLFEGYPSIVRLSKDCLINEKLDGTNAQILILDDGQVLAGSRTRLLTLKDDNKGFARWVEQNADELRSKLGVGRHFGEWWGSGIGRGYALSEKKFSLFRADLWTDQPLPRGVEVVPVLYRGPFSTQAVDECLDKLRASGSVAAPGFMQPEGVVVYHVAADILFKKTLDDLHKWQQTTG